MTIISRIQKNLTFTIITSLLLGCVVLLLSQLLQKLSLPFIENYFDLSFYTENVIFKLYVILLSIAFILLVNKGSVKDYGFSIPKKTNYLKLSLLTVGITIVSMIAGRLLFMGLLNHFFPCESSLAFPEVASLMEWIITIWICSSISEEILVRGLVQGFMSHLKDIKIMRLSLPVLISGLFFGLMHLSLLRQGMGLWFVASIVFFTTSIGVLAAYYREKTKSLIAPILVHIIANMFGALPLIIKMISE